MNDSKVFHVYGYTWIETNDGTLKQVNTFTGTAKDKTEYLIMCDQLKACGYHSNVISNGRIVHHV